MSEINLRYKLLYDDSVNGVKLQLFSNFDNEIAEVIKRENVVSLMLSQWLGWKFEPLDFLAKLPQLKALYVFDSTLKDISKVSNLANLEVLYLECPKLKIGFEVSKLIHLRDVRIDWKPCLNNLSESNSIEVLLLSGFTEKNLCGFLPLSIKRLDLIKPSKLENLKGLEKANHLKSISLYQCRKLYDIETITSLNLASIEIDGCKQVKGLSRLIDLVGLELLVIDNCGQMETIAGISKLSKLQKLRIASTTILDGDLSELIGLRINYLFFDRNKSYSHTLEEIKNS